MLAGACTFKVRNSGSSAYLRSRRFILVEDSGGVKGIGEVCGRQGPVQNTGIAAIRLAGLRPSDQARFTEGLGLLPDIFASGWPG